MMTLVSSVSGTCHLLMMLESSFTVVIFFIIQATGLIKDGGRVQTLKVLYGCQISVENVLRERISVID